MTDCADLLAWQLTTTKHIGWVRELQFHPTRKWRIDVAFPEKKLAIEVEGFAKDGKPGRHQRAFGFTKDCEKYAQLAIAGWRLIRVTTQHVKSGVALQWIEEALGGA